MDNDERYRRAKARVAALRGFYIHAAVYGLVNGGLLLLNLLVSPASLWFYWSLLGWGIGLAAHALSVFGGLLGRDWEERQIRRLMDQEEGRRPDQDELPVEAWPDPRP